LSRGLTISVAVIGAKRDPRPWEHIHYVYGAELTQIIHLMQRAKRAVITIDSGPSRLAHVANIANHLIICPDAYPKAWVTHPNAHMIVGNRKSWGVSQIVEAVQTMNEPSYVYNANQ